MPTYKQVKQTLWEFLESRKWVMSNPSLKVPHATSSNGLRDLR